MSTPVPCTRGWSARHLPGWRLTRREAAEQHAAPGRGGRRFMAITTLKWEKITSGVVSMRSSFVDMWVATSLQHLRAVCLSLSLSAACLFCFSYVADKSKQPSYEISFCSSLDVYLFLRIVLLVIIVCVIRVDCNESLPLLLLLLLRGKGVVGAKLLFFWMNSFNILLPLPVLNVQMEGRDPGTVNAG